MFISFVVSEKISPKIVKMDGSGRTWQATVQPTATPMPNAGDFSRAHAQDVYTKTSLAANRDIQNLNREILNATQAYNNTPRPFKRENETKETNQGASFAAAPSARSDVQQVRFVRQESARVTSSRENVQCANQVNKEDNMAPKLVHKQYNSPIDLYSMNNIRKTIEAHTELIAPGIKGINFMKPETPVNKQSEVYKLVKEEEKLRNQQGAPRLSPISGQPLAQGSCMSIDRSTAEYDEQQQPLQHQQDGGLIQPPRGKYCKVNPDSGREQLVATEKSTLEATADTGVPRCCECGQCIVGPFAKIQNRFVHPHCFNCTTCGTSLKNTGYFTINEKLYCGIHAKQVAKVMRIKFDFDDKHDKQERQTQTSTRQQQVQSEARLHQSGERFVQSPTVNYESSNAATISTMFANRPQNHASQPMRGTDWSHQIHTLSRDGQATVDSHSSCVASSSSFRQQESSQVRSSAPSARVAQQQSILSSSRMGRGVIEEDSIPVGTRTPICVHCHARIQGPYILAGKATWCKHCSQNNFHCSSCYRSLLDTGFIEDSSHKYYCEHCFEAYYAPICSKCNIRIKGDCLNALNKQWHPSCFVCNHCHRPFGNSSFYLEDNLPYCERDWNLLFTTKCYSCSNPIEAGDKWIEALNRNYHSNCFRCTSCQANLEGSTFYCKGGKPFCRLHAR